MLDSILPTVVVVMEVASKSVTSTTDEGLAMIQRELLARYTRSRPFVTFNFERADAQPPKRRKVLSYIESLLQKATSRVGHDTNCHMCFYTCMGYTRSIWGRTPIIAVTGAYPGGPVGLFAASIDPGLFNNTQDFAQITAKFPTDPSKQPQVDGSFITHQLIELLSAEATKRMILGS